MDLLKWSRSNAEYGRKLWHSGIEGARSSREQFLSGDTPASCISNSGGNLLKTIALGACIGMLRRYSLSREKSLIKTLTCGLAGGVIGLGAGVVWESRHLTVNVAGGALRNIGRVRDEQWLSSHPIDYA